MRSTFHRGPVRGPVSGVKEVSRMRGRGRSRVMRALRLEGKLPRAPPEQMAGMQGATIRVPPATDGGASGQRCCKSLPRARVRPNAGRACRAHVPAEDHAQNAHPVRRRSGERRGQPRVRAHHQQFRTSCTRRSAKRSCDACCTTNRFSSYEPHMNLIRTPTCSDGVRMTSELHPNPIRTYCLGRKIQHHSEATACR